MDTSLDAGRGGLQSAQQNSLITQPTGPDSLSKRLRPTDSIVRVILLFCGVVSIFTTVGIVAVLGNETLLFFDANAYTLAQAPVLEQEDFSTLQEPLDAEASTLVVDSLNDNVAPDRYIQVNREIMQINGIGVAPVTLGFERGAANTTPRDHAAGQPIYLLERTEIATTTTPISPEQTSLSLSVDQTDDGISLAEQFIQIGDELMRVTEAGSGLVSAQVERGMSGTEVRTHDEDTAISLVNLRQIGEVSDGLSADQSNLQISLSEDDYNRLSEGAQLQIGDESGREIVSLTDTGTLSIELDIRREAQASEAARHEAGEPVGLLQAISLAEPINAEDTTLVLDFEMERVPFADDQFIRVGTEVMQIVDRGRRTITVERAKDGTEAVAHETDQFVFGMREAMIHPLEPLESVQSIQELEWQATDLEHVAVGDEIQYLNMTWRVDNFSTSNVMATCLGEGQYNLEEFTNFNRPYGLGEGESIRHDNIQWVTQEVTDEAVMATCDKEAQTNISWSQIDEPMPRTGSTLTHEGQTWTLTDYDTEGVQIERCNTGQSSTITVDEGFGHVFTTGSTIRLGLEDMRVQNVQGDSLTVERCINNTDGYAHEPDNEGQFETLRIAKQPSITEFFTTTRWQPQGGNFGIWPLLNSTLIVSAVAMFVAIPLGLGAAIYLSEYAPQRVSNILTPILEILAGIPTVVYGFFALTWMSPTLRAIFGPDVQYYNMLSAGIVVGILIIPYVGTMSRDALSAVPLALREASYGLGATKLETTVKVVLPAAASGVIASFILGISRAVGETMIVTIAAGSGPNYTFNLFEGAETMTGHIARISSGDISYDSIDYNSIFAIAALLFIVTFTLNIVSDYISRQLRESY